MNHKYFKQGLDYIEHLCKKLEDNWPGSHFERPSDVCFMEQWMADGMWITWKYHGDVYFKVCAIWKQYIWKQDQNGDQYVNYVDAIVFESCVSNDRVNTEINNDADLIEALINHYNAEKNYLEFLEKQYNEEFEDQGIAEVL
jgi:hypothetical protein